MDVLSLFSGCGGMDLGFAEAGFNIVTAVDTDKAACAIHAANFPATRALHMKVEDFYPTWHYDGVIGGPPCQSFSVGGNGDGKGVTMLNAFVDKIRQAMPSFFVMENVAALASDRHFKIFHAMLDRLHDMYYYVTWKILDADDYGCGQNRKRLFIVGFRDEEVLKKFRWPQHKSKRVLSDILAGMPDFYFRGDLEAYSPRFMSRNRIRGWWQPSFTIPATERQVPLHPDSNPMQQISRNVWEFTGPVRRLTWQECARIQGFPNGFNFFPVESIKIADAYRVIGNAVPVGLAQAVAESVREAFHAN